MQASGIGDVIGGADSFISKGQKGADSTISSDEIQTTSNLIYNVLLIVGVCIAVIIGVILGIQFITGSVEQKSKVKETLIPYVTGCIVIFGAFGIWKLVITILR